MLTPKSIKAPHGASQLEIEWSDSSRSRLPHDVLRGYCPCAGCQGHASSIRYRTGGNLELIELAPVGNYALGFTWGDGHNSGIYTYRFLKQLSDLIDEHGHQGLIDIAELPRS